MILLALAAVACAATTPIPVTVGPAPFNFDVPALGAVRSSLAIVRSTQDGYRHTAFAVAGNQQATFFITTTSAICDMSDPEACLVGIQLKIPPADWVDATVVAGGPIPRSPLTLLQATTPGAVPARVLRHGGPERGQPIATATANAVDDPPLLGALLMSASDVERYALVHAIGGDTCYVGAPLFDPISGDVLGVNAGIPDGRGLARGYGPSEIDNLLKGVGTLEIGHVPSVDAPRAVVARRDGVERVAGSIWRLTIPKSDATPNDIPPAPCVATAFVVGSDARWTYFVTAAHASRRVNPSATTSSG